MYEECVKNNLHLSKKRRIIRKLKSIRKSNHISKSKIEIKKQNFINCFSKKINTELVIIDAVNSKENILSHFISIENEKNTRFIIIDNIHYNKLATEAWEEIIHLESVSLSVDFYHLGLISISKDFTKQHFRLKM